MGLKIRWAQHLRQILPAIIIMNAPRDEPPIMPSVCFDRGHEVVYQAQYAAAGPGGVDMMATRPTPAYVLPIFVQIMGRLAIKPTGPLLVSGRSFASARPIVFYFTLTVTLVALLLAP